jgi:hypothetical protein
MLIEVEDGTDFQRKQITAELMRVCKRLDKLPVPIRIHEVIVAKDIVETVNRLQGTTSAFLSRITRSSNIVPVGKLVELDGLIYIILSSTLFATEHDAQTRSFVLVHEVGHLINKRSFPNHDLSADRVYLHLLYTLYDEYLADFNAYKMVDMLFPKKSAIWQNRLYDSSLDFMKIASDPALLQEIRSNARKFQGHRNMDLFLSKTNEIIETIAIAITHLFANTDYQGLRASDFVDPESTFINEHTFALMDDFRMAAEQGRFDVHEYKSDIADFLTNFGVFYTDTQSGLFCKITEI